MPQLQSIAIVSALLRRTAVSQRTRPTLTLTIEGQLFAQEQILHGQSAAAS